MTRAILVLPLLLLLTLPSATVLAIDRLPPREFGGKVGPCEARQTFYVDNTFTTFRCGIDGTELVYHRSGSGFAGYQCTTRVAGQTVQDCRDGILP